MTESLSWMVSLPDHTVVWIQIPPEGPVKALPVSDVALFDFLLL